MQAGQDLRLVIRDVNAERVLLAITDPHEADQAQPSQQAQPARRTRRPNPCTRRAGDPDPSLAAQPPVPLPGGGDVQVTERDAGGAGGQAGDRQNVLLRYNAPALGSVDLRFQMDAGALSLSVTLPAGQPLELAQAGAESLRQALLQAVPGRAVSVTVAPRREPLDLYA